MCNAMGNPMVRCNRMINGYSNGRITKYGIPIDSPIASLPIDLPIDQPGSLLPKLSGGSPPPSSDAQHLSGKPSSDASVHRRGGGYLTVPFRPISSSQTLLLLPHLTPLQDT